MAQSIHEQAFLFYTYVASNIGMGEVWMRYVPEQMAIELAWYPSSKKDRVGERFWREIISLESIVNRPHAAAEVVHRMREAHRATVTEGRRIESRPG